jgi:hypothetical protein
MLIVALLLVACGGQTTTPEPTAVPTTAPPATETAAPATATTPPDPTPEAEPTEAEYAFGEAEVEDVTVARDMENPQRLQVTAQGSLADGCTQIDDVNVKREGDTFNVSITTVREIDAICTQALVPFEETVTIDLTELEDDATYNLNVNGVTDSFTTIPIEEPGAAAVNISPTTASPGDTVTLTASGLPANAEVAIGVGPIRSEYDIVDTAVTDDAGEIVRDVVVPQYADVDEEWVFVVETADDSYISNSVAVVSEDAVLFDRTDIYLTAIGDAGESGEEFGCGDSIVPVGITIAPTVAPLTAALEQMFGFEDEYFGQSGLYNVFYQSDLVVEGIDINNGVAEIALSGELALSGECDAPRVQAQIRQTALQYDTIEEVNVTLNGEPLDEALSLQ